MTGSDKAAEIAFASVFVGDAFVVLNLIGIALHIAQV
jgi:hypothetical protein